MFWNHFCTSPVLLLFLRLPPMFHHCSVVRSVKMACTKRPPQFFLPSSSSPSFSSFSFPLLLLLLLLLLLVLLLPVLNDLNYRWCYSFATGDLFCAMRTQERGECFSLTLDTGAEMLKLQSLWQECLECGPLLPLGAGLFHFLEFLRAMRIACNMLILSLRLLLLVYAAQSLLGPKKKIHVNFIRTSLKQIARSVNFSTSCYFCLLKAEV